MLHVLVLLAATSAEPIVSTAWLQAHLTDPQVRVIFDRRPRRLRPGAHPWRPIHQSHGYGRW